MIKCLLVDDEFFALALLEKHLSSEPDMEVVGKCKSPIAAIEFLNANEVDLLFLDIQMPLLSGVKLLRSISQKPTTIFTTAYTQYAHEAFDLDAVDYLLKPFSQERLQQALQKARTALQVKNEGQTTAGPEGSITVKADRQWVRVVLSDIRYIEGWKEYVKIHTREETFVTLERMSKMEEMLPDAFFLRVHKSFIIACNAVTKMDGDCLIIGQNRIPVSRSKKKEVLASLFLDGD